MKVDDAHINEHREPL